LLHLVLLSGGGASAANLTMNIRIIATALLAVIVIVLAWYLASTEPPAPEPVITRLAGFDPEAIQQIRITRTGKDVIVLTKTLTGWDMNSPVEISANPFRINSILAISQTQALTLSDMDDITLTQLGFSPASVSLALDEHLFTFGNTEPIHSGRYVMYDNTVYIVEDNLYQQLLQEPGFFINTRLLDADSKLVQIKYPGFELHFRDNVWVVVDDDITLTPDELNNVTATWTGLEAIRVTTSINNVYPADIVLVTGAGDQIALAVTATTDGLILSRKDTGLDYWFNPDSAAQLLIALIQED
jgi:hypothetical protein